MRAGPAGEGRHGYAPAEAQWQADQAIVLCQQLPQAGAASQLVGQALQPAAERSAGRTGAWDSRRDGAWAWACAGDWGR